MGDTGLGNKHPLDICYRDIREMSGMVSEELLGTGHGNECGREGVPHERGRVETDHFKIDTLCRALSSFSSPDR